MNIDERLLAYKPISVTLNFDWDKMSYDERVLARHKYIEEQKKKDPNYVGYDFIEHRGSTHGGRVRNPINITDLNKLINTLGQVLIPIKDEITITFGNADVHGYPCVTLKKNDRYIKLKIHRLVACTFIPIPEHLKENRYKLVINHKNDVKNCNLRSNLEWCTNQENLAKALETGAKKSMAFKFTITRPGEYFNKGYYFTNAMALKKYGFSSGRVYDYINNKQPYLCGTWELVPREEIKDKVTGISKHVIDYIRGTKYGRVHAKGNVGTIISEGPCKGEQFVIYGNVQSKLLGFNSGCIKMTSDGKRTQHMGCTWKRIPRREVGTIPIGLTEQQKKHIFG